MNRKEKADLANIELMFPSDLFLKGEELHEASGVLECIKLEKNLYTFIIQDGKRYEVEWLKPLTRQQRASCECSFFKAEKICKHAIAALIAYKQLITEELESTQVERRQSTLSISNILNHVSKEELKNFLKTYAQTDRRLATALKVHFARRVDLQDNEKKYKSILDAVIRPVTSGNDKFKASEVKSLSQIANEFFDQAEDALALGEHSEAFILSKTALTKLCYTYHHGHYHETKLETDILRAHEILYHLSGLAKSQELVVAIRHFLAEIAHFSYYPYLSLRHNALMMLLKQQAVPEDAIHIAETQLKRKRDSEVQIVVLLSMIMLIGESQQQDHDIDHRYFTYLEKVASLLVSNGYYKTAANMCHKYRTVSKDMPLWHLKALAMLEKKELIAEAVSYFVAGKDLRIIELLKPLLSEKEFQQFRKKVTASGLAKSADPFFYAQYLYRSGQIEELLKWQQKHKDFRMMMDTDEYMYPLYPAEITDLYEEMTESFLTKHIGKNSYVFMDELFAHLNQIKAVRIVNKLGMMIEMKFPHRSRLEDHLK